MKSRVVLSALVVIGSLALSAPAAQAGNGGSPSPLTSFFVCHGISKGTASGASFDVDSSFFGTNPLRVTIGSGVLACAFAKLFPGGSSAHIPCPGAGCNEIDPNPGLNEQLKCYSFSASRQPSSAPPNLYDVSDVLLSQDLGVQANQLHFICAPANFGFAP